MELWKVDEMAGNKLSKKAYDLYCDSDYYIFKNVDDEAYRLCVQRSYKELVFETDDFNDINIFFEELADSMNE